MGLKDTTDDLNAQSEIGPGTKEQQVINVKQCWLREIRVTSSRPGTLIVRSRLSLRITTVNREVRTPNRFSIRYQNSLFWTRERQ
jgi:hypothetical protein